MNLFQSLHSKVQFILLFMIHLTVLSVALHM
jgi:hypothetical protein